VVIISPGPTDRAGAHRLSIKLAERFARMGHPVLRFDARGAGESEADWSAGYDGKPILDVYKNVEEGVWVPDTHAAMRHLAEKAGVSRFVLGGVCGGAITALLAGGEHPSVDGIFMIGNPVTLSVESLTDISRLPEETLRKDAGRYVRKVLHPSAWVRLITLQSDYKVLWAVLVSRVRRLAPNTQESERTKLLQAMSPAFLRAFVSAVRNQKRLLFVYSANDHHWHEFKGYFLETRSEPERRAMEVACIQDANHNLTEERWQEELYERLLPWLKATALRQADA
jgi:pimeloyl-ACP methyl ester carboxylesterase